MSAYILVNLILVRSLTNTKAHIVEVQLIFNANVISTLSKYRTKLIAVLDLLVLLDVLGFPQNSPARIRLIATYHTYIFHTNFIHINNLFLIFLKIKLMFYWTQRNFVRGSTIWKVSENKVDILLDFF